MACYIPINVIIKPDSIIYPYTVENVGFCQPFATLAIDHSKIVFFLSQPDPLDYQWKQDSGPEARHQQRQVPSPRRGSRSYHWPPCQSSPGLQLSLRPFDDSCNSLNLVLYYYSFSISFSLFPITPQDDSFIVYDNRRRGSPSELIIVVCVVLVLRSGNNSKWNLGM